MTSKRVQACLVAFNLWCTSLISLETISSIHHTIRLKERETSGQASSITSKVAKMLAYGKTLEIMKNKLRKTSDFYLPSRLGLWCHTRKILGASGTNMGLSIHRALTKEM